MAGPGLKFMVGLSVFGLLTACGDKPAVEKERPRVFVQEVKLADYAASVTLTGDVQARVQTELSFRVAGKIIQRTVDVGDRVTAKQVLARLDPKDLQTSVDSAQAQVVAEQARVKQTSAAFVRQQNSYPRPTPAKANMTRPRPRRAAARAHWPRRRRSWPTPVSN